MPVEYTVQQGDCLASIAKQYGFSDWNTIYNDDSNTNFRKLRPDPHVLLPGDRLSIPDKKIKSEFCQTAQVHTFQLTNQPIHFRVVVRNIDGQPLGGKKYKLSVGDATYEGVLPDNGLVDQPIPPDALEGKLTVWTDESDPELMDTWALKLGHLDPVESLTGVQARLNNLGYDCGPVDGINGPRTQAAVRAFQQDQGLDVDGIPGPKTQAALKTEHNC